jgi:quercetin dioxygenase-like cupin family protein
MFDHILSKSDCVARNPFPGVRMFIAEGQQMTVSLVEMDPHAAIPEHSHPHEQVGYMIEGEAEFVVAGRASCVSAGQMWRLPGGTPHQVITGDRPMRAMDVFYPIREDYRRTPSVAAQLDH